jgi:hypothetical protein
MGHMDVSENLVHSTPMDFKCPSFFPYKIYDIDRAHVDKRTVTVDMHILSSYLVIIVSHLNIYIYILEIHQIQEIFRAHG